MSDHSRLSDASRCEVKDGAAASEAFIVLGPVSAAPLRAVPACTGQGLGDGWKPGSSPGFAPAAQTGVTSTIVTPSQPRLRAVSAPLVAPFRLPWVET